MLTPGLFFLLLVTVWFGLAAASGVVVYWLTRRPFISAVASLLVVALPTWDLVPGWLLYGQAVKDLGGVRIHRSVEVDGYLARTNVDYCGPCWVGVITKPGRYGYVEYELDASPTDLRTRQFVFMATTSFHWLSPTPNHARYSIGGRAREQSDDEFR